jgi:transmembrane sensor
MKSNEHFLADWLDGKITDEELRQLVPPADFKSYLKIRRTLSLSQIADPDIELNLAMTKQKLAEGSKPRRLTRAKRFLYAAAMAACILIAAALFNIFSFGAGVRTNSNTTGLVWDDGTMITVGTGSSLERTRLYSLNRKVRMDGQAYFEVSKGRSFKVSTPEGSVEVLGTKFSVLSREGYFEVICYEGHVRVHSKDFSADLKKGDAFRRYHSESENYSVTDQNPGWIGQESTFLKAPVEIVIDRLATQYGYEVDYPQELKPVRFTGSFTHGDLDKALQSVLTPLGMKYEIGRATIRVYP